MVSQPRLLPAPPSAFNPMLWKPTVMPSAGGPLADTVVYVKLTVNVPVEKGVLFHAEPAWPPALGVSCSEFCNGNVALPLAVQPAPPAKPDRAPAGTPASESVPPVRLTTLVPSAAGAAAASFPPLTVTPPVNVLFP